MNNSVTRSQAVVMTAMAILVVLAGWSYARLGYFRTAAITAEEDLSKCQKLAVEMELLRGKPLCAAAEVHSATERIDQIQRAGKDTKLSHDNLGLIAPEPSQRVADSSYKVQPTRVDLEGVSMQQLVSFLHHLTDDEQGMNIRELLLTPLRDTGANSPQDECWSVDIVLTHLVFSPKSSPQK